MNLAFFKRLIKIFVALIVFYVLSLTAVFSLPKENIEKHALENIGTLVIHEPGVYRFNRDIKLLCDGPASYVDALTDATMLTRNINYNNYQSEEAGVIQAFFRFSQSFSDKIYANPFLNAMNMNGYGRYWQGYEIILRPLLVVFNYNQIRYFNIFWFIALVLVVSFMFWQQIGRAFTAFFWVGLVLCKFPLIPLSMQFMNMFALMLTSLLVQHNYLKLGKAERLENGKYERVYEWSFALGSLTVFFDFLTTPLLPWGMCILYLMVYMQKKYQYIFPWMFYFKNALAWCSSCIITWIVKWVLCTEFLGYNMFQEAYLQICERLTGNFIADNGMSTEVTPLAALMVNIRMLFEPALFLLVVVGMFILALPLLKYKFPVAQRNKQFERQLLFIGFVPCFWYMVITNHSEIHFWYTYRSLLISVISLSVYCQSVIDWRIIFSYKKDN